MKNVRELKSISRDRWLRNYSQMRKAELELSFAEKLYPLCSAHAKCGLEVSYNCKSFVENVYMAISDTWYMINGSPLL